MQHHQIDSLPNQNNNQLQEQKQYHLLLTEKLLEENVLNPEESRVLWLIDDINNLNMEITQEISGDYTPHELGYPATARIDFEKGCYTGQEIVARMHYRAKRLPTVLLKNSSNKLTGSEHPKEGPKDLLAYVTTSINM